MAPQLYWAIDPPAQSFPVLLQWWQEQNPKRRHLWPGINSLKVGAPWPAKEIANQIEITRKNGVGPGVIHWSHSALMNNESLRTTLKRDIYRQPALVPAFKWLDATAPAPPKIDATLANGKTRITWELAGAQAERPAWWILQSLEFSDWKTQFLPGPASSFNFGLKPEAVAVTAVDRCGNTSPPTVVKLAK
jgi:hypothetical protein